MMSVLMKNKVLPEWSIELFLQDVKTIQDTKGDTMELDLVFKCVNFFLFNGQFDEVQKIADAIDVAQFTPSVLLSFCMQFWNAQRNGIIYEPFRQKCEEEIRRTCPEEDVDEVFRGLKGVPTGPTLGSLLRGLNGANQNLY